MIDASVALGSAAVQGLALHHGSLRSVTASLAASPAWARELA